MPSVWPGEHVIGEDRRSKNGVRQYFDATHQAGPRSTDSATPPRAPYTLMLIPGCVEATIQGLAAAHFGCVRLVLPEVSRRPLLLLPPEPEPELPLHRVHLLRLGASASGVLVSGWLPNLAADGVLSNIQPATANDVLPDLLAANSAMPVMAVSLMAIILAMSAGPIEKRERF